MRVRSVTFAQIRNTGNYENQRAEATVELNDDDSPAGAFAEARVIVEHMLDIKRPKPPVVTLEEIKAAFATLNRANIKGYDEYGDPLFAEDGMPLKGMP